MCIRNTVKIQIHFIMQPNYASYYSLFLTHNAKFYLYALVLTNDWKTVHL